MALVCDIKSETKVEPIEAVTNEDLEDGEIEDDDEDVPPPTTTTVAVAETTNANKPMPNEKTFPPFENRHDKFERPKFERPRPKHEDKKKNHLTEAEKSVMFLHKLERMEREKREKYRREPVDDFASNIEKAIASVLKKERPSDEEKDEDKRGKKRKKKERDRKKKQRKTESPKSDEVDENEMLNVRGGSPEHRSNKDISPKTDETYSEDTDYSTDKSGEERRDAREKRREKRERKARNKNRRGGEGNRENKNKMSEQQPKDSPQLCVYYLQGKCQKGDDCQYSHDSQPPMKWELCKFYLNDCCAKGDKCLYMHSDFPCKFYHTGQPCLEGENCKFAHGKPLSDRLKQILFKHIETAPKDILGRFPRMNREEAVFKINQTQKHLEGKYGIEKKDNSDQSKIGIPSLFDINIPVPVELIHDDTKKDKNDKPIRSRPSRWQEADPMDKSENFQEQRKTKSNFKPFIPSQDQDMRLSSLPITSNGDIDMRTLPPIPIQPPNISQPESPPSKSNMLVVGSQRSEDSNPVDIEQYKREAGFSVDSTNMDVDIRSIRCDIDIRNHNTIESMTGRDVDIRKMDIDTRQQQLELFNRQDVDIRQQAFTSSVQQNMTEDDGEDKLEIVMNDEPERDKDNRFAFDVKDLPVNLPKRQRELYMRIQAQQKENLFEDQQNDHSDSEQSNIDWYSDDSNEGKLMIKCDEDVKEKEEEPMTTTTAPTTITPLLVEKLGDLSKINISEEVTKLLSSMRQSNSLLNTPQVLTSPQVLNSPQDTIKPKDPRHTSTDTSEEPKIMRLDPRKSRLSSTEDKPKPEKVSIYEQGSIDTDSMGKDIDLRSIDKDLDLRPNFPDLDLRSSAASGRPDVDLRQLALPFKAIQNYTPATEIDASYSSHPPISWAISIVDIPKPDYTGLKLSKQEAQTTGDPRLRKIFRLDMEEKDSPASPKQSPKSMPIVRVDPRIRKAEEPKLETAVMSYAQQMNVLQGSSFYQNLTSNQKVMLNQELSNREQTGGTGANEQALAGILNALGLGQSGPANMNANVLGVLSTISNIALNSNVLQNPNINVQNPNPGIIGPNPGIIGPNSNLMNQNLPQNPNIIPGQVNPNILGQGGNLLNQMPQSIIQPGLLGAAPGIPNIPPDFQINFDPRNGGLLGNAPPFVNFQDNQNFNFNEDFFPEGGGNFNNNRDGRFNRDNRPPRRGRNFNRNRNNFRNRNRSNRGGHASP